MAASEGAKEAMYLRRYLDELGDGVSKPTSQATDNTGARDLAYNPEHHQKVKHIQRRHFYIRECVEDMQLTVPYVATADNMADFFTKALSSKEFFYFRDRIMNVHPNLRHCDRKAAKENVSTDASVAGGVWDIAP